MSILPIAKILHKKDSRSYGQGCAAICQTARAALAPPVSPPPRVSEAAQQQLLGEPLVPACHPAHHLQRTPRQRPKTHQRTVAGAAHGVLPHAAIVSRHLAVPVADVAKRLAPAARAGAVLREGGGALGRKIAHLPRSPEVLALEFVHVVLRVAPD